MNYQEEVINILINSHANFHYGFCLDMMCILVIGLCIIEAGL